MKRVILSILLMALLIVGVFAEDVLYEQNFDEYELAVGSNFNGWNFYKGKTASTSTVTVKDGAMYFDANSTGYDVVFAEGLSFSNYTVEADVTFLKDTGWFGLAYNVQSGKIWQKGTLGIANNKISLNGYVSGWKNNVTAINHGTFDNSSLALGDTVRIKITTNGANATMSYALYTGGVLGDYIDVITIGNIPEGYQNGSVGFMMGANANNTSIKVDNIKVISNVDASVLYEENFNELALKKGVNAGIGFNYYMKTNTSSTAVIKDGALHFHKDSTDGGYEMIYLTDANYKNYTVEADFTYLAPTKDSKGWAGLAFNVLGDTTFFKSSLGLDNRVSINGIVSNSWKYDKEGLNKKDFTTNITEGVTYRVKLTTVKNKATLWYAFYNSDGTLGEYTEVMTIDNIPADMQSGSIGFNLARVVETYVIIDNVKVTSTDVVYDLIADVYEPDTGIVNPAVVIEKVDSALPVASGKSAAVALMEIDADMNIVFDGKVIASVDDFMNNCAQTVIPAFIIDSEAEASALISYLDGKYISDAVVVADSSKASLVKNVRESCKTVRGALIFDNLSTAEAQKAACATVHDNMSYIAIYNGLLDMDAITYLNNRQVAVWCTVESESDVYTSVANGYNGVISSDISMVYDVYERITEVTVSGEPIIIAHRGSRVGTPENTITAFREAVDKYGCKAIETDIRFSSDGVCYLMHDSTVDRTTNGTGKGAGMTMAELKALTVDEVAGKEDVVPTWEEAVAEFKDSDVVFYCHINVTSEACVTEFCRIVDKYDFWDNVVFFISYEKRTTYNSESDKISNGISFVAGDYPSLVAGETDLDCIRMFIEGLTPYNYQALFYDYDSYALESFYYQLSARGFLNYHSITDTQAKLDKTFLTELGVGGALTNDIDLTDDYAYAIAARDVTLYSGNSIPLIQTVSRITNDTEEECKILQLSGTPLVKTDSGYMLADEGSVTVVYYADVRAGECEYRIYSAPITVTYGGKENLDLNGDGEINIADALLVLKMVVNCVYNAQADLNGDGNVNLIDTIRCFKSVIE